MSDGGNDPDLVLRAALVKAADELAPEIRGLRGLLRIIDQNSPLQRDLVAALERVDSRHTLIVRTIDHYGRFTDARRRLEEDGYPAPLPPLRLSPDLSLELQVVIAAVAAAAGIAARAVVTDPAPTAQDGVPGPVAG